MLKKEVIITPDDFKKDDIVYKKICMDKPKYSVIMGIVIDENNTPVVDALVMIYSKNIMMKTCCNDFLGYTKTDCSGIFTALIKQSNYLDYIIEIYEPLKS